MNNIGKRVQLKEDPSFIGTIIETHNTKYGLDKKHFSAYKIQWDNGNWGICELKDLIIL